MSSAICFNLDLSKILSSGNGLNSIGWDFAGKEIHDRAADCAEPDQSAYMCRLISL